MPTKIAVFTFAILAGLAGSVAAANADARAPRRAPARPAPGPDGGAYRASSKAPPARYPSIPAGTLEAIAYVQSRWHHIAPADAQADEHQHMPQAFGVMGLYRGGGF